MRHLPTASAAGLAILLSATPAFALEADATPPPAPAPGWVAPFDDVAGRELMLFGLVRVRANEGRLDRMLRIGAAGGLGALVAFDPLTLGGTARIGLGAVGAVLGVTALTGACPAYMPFGFDTRDRQPVAPPAP